ncbi:putative inner membrane protein YjeT [Vibrio astriarenae]|uniref:DUF2065 family protein n=1 Tax=Vibrio astriarenae TaxID=1481923 RepID=A0A7Z2T4P4_9VIBR|nr:DUF2065 domain-containing protein [Vibrio astriarenae]QIA64359.1 DUF2065 family protein [Vibrio astriarenae]GAL15809.1 putative inner membrane protein YjeT [Vibrio sp. C7]
MSETIWLALGIFLILEGLGPLLAPNGWRKMLLEIISQPEAQLRRIGGCLVVSGLVMVYCFI